VPQPISGAAVDGDLVGWIGRRRNPPVRGERSGGLRQADALRICRA